MLFAVADELLVIYIHTEDVAYGVSIGAKSMIFNELEQRNDRYPALFHQNWEFFFWGGGYLTVVEVRSTLFGARMYPQKI